MRIPLWSFPRLFSLLTAGLLIAALVAAGCRGRPTSHIANVEDLEGGTATLDARGATVDSEVYLGQRTNIEGTAGNGGQISITSTGGAVTIASTPRSFDINAIVAGMTGLVGVGLTVDDDDEVEVAGGLVRDFLIVERGGKLLLRDNTTFIIAGDVLIQGEVLSRGDRGSVRRDGRDLTIVAGGSVVITGVVNCSGENAEQLPVSNQPGTGDPREDVTFGGHGGVLTIAATATATSDIVITGAVKAEGGGSDSLDAAKGVSGQGGQIVLRCGRNFRSVGQISARAGNSYTNNFTTGPEGGRIEITAGEAGPGAVTIEEALTLNATGGRNSGVTGGNGGAITIDASGAATITSVTIDASGGNLVFRDGGTAGDGGQVSVTAGTTMTLDGVILLASGGDSIREAEATGGDGGAVTLDASGALAVIETTTDSVIEARGGDSRSLTVEGGEGGSLRVLASTVTFVGTANVRGGNDAGGRETQGGTICVTGTIVQPDRANLQGVNDPLIVPCPP